MKIFNMVFNVGLGIAAAILLSRNTGLIQFLLYIGITHLLILISIAWKSQGLLAPAMVEGLHKAGFLHTLMALAAALVVSARLFGAVKFTPADLSQVLLPMGAALVPHVLGVWGGQLVGSRYFEAAPAIEESIFKKLAEDADAAREGIRQLFGERERALREQIAALQLQQRLLDEMHERSVKTLDQASTNLSTLAGAVQRISSELGSSLATLAATIKSVVSSAGQAATDINDCSTQVRECAGGLREATKVVQDVHKLHDAISQLLNEKLFSREAQA